MIMNGDIQTGCLILFYTWRTIKPYSFGCWLEQRLLGKMKGNSAAYCKNSFVVRLCRITVLFSLPPLANMLAREDF